MIFLCGNDIDGLNEIYVEGIANGTDPLYNEFWEEI